VGVILIIKKLKASSLINPSDPPAKNLNESDVTFNNQTQGNDSKFPENRDLKIEDYIEEPPNDSTVQ
jgi:hypothetical protein